MLKQPMTTAELFDEIVEQLKDKKMLPDIIDYALANQRHSVPVKTNEFDIRNKLDFGGSEGIYLCIAIEYYEEGKWKTTDIGTFKTLGVSQEDMEIMGKLLADFVYETHKYVEENSDDFDWIGYNVKTEGKTFWNYTCYSLENALKRKDDLLQKGARSVTIRNNETRKEEEYKKEKLNL